MAPYIHHVPGRLRVRTAAIKRNECEADQDTQLLAGAPGVISVNANVLTGSITVRYDPATATDAAILTTLREHGYLPSPVEPQPPRDLPEMPAARIGRQVDERATRLIVEMMIERFAVAAVGALV